MIRILLNKIFPSVAGILRIAVLTLILLSGLVGAGYRSDVYLQGFYWNSPPGGIWWDSLRVQASQLANAGFSGIWIPSPVKGMSGGWSMGYDPYDHYDFGEYDQQWSRETRFGSRQELLDMIGAFHDVNIEVYVDAVMNHMNGGEAKIPYECKPYPSYPDSGWLLFDYPYGSGRFKKNASHFYPNSQTCDVNPDYHGASDPIYQFGEWLAHDRSFVRDSLIVWGEYLKNVIGADGFRLDAVKGIDPAFMGAWLNAVNSDGFAVAEYWGSFEAINYWHNTAQYYGGNVSMFDFPLRDDLKSMCNNSYGSYDMRYLDGAGLINGGISSYNVSTFVENHDMDRIGYDGNGSDDPAHDPIYQDKDMAYAYILFSEGKPTVFYKDYYAYGLQGIIDTLIQVRARYLGGGTDKRVSLDPWYIRQDGSQDQDAIAQDIYVARRQGYGDQIGGYLVLNDNPSQWIDVWVNVWADEGTVFHDYSGHDADKTVVGGSSVNRIKLWCPPRSYTLYVADTTPLDFSLPVTLASFDADYSSQGAELSWTTSSEIENRGFNIYRRESSADESTLIASYLDLPALRGAGSSTEEHRYSYTDMTVIPGTEYTYTLADVSFEGIETRHPLQSSTIRIPQAAAVVTDNFILENCYPNPFNATLNIPFTINRNMHIRIVLHDIRGAEIMTVLDTEMQAGYHVHRMNADALPSGLYFTVIHLDEDVHAMKVALLK